MKQVRDANNRKFRLVPKEHFGRPLTVLLVGLGLGTLWALIGTWTRREDWGLWLFLGSVCATTIGAEGRIRRWYIALSFVALLHLPIIVIDVADRLLSAPGLRWLLGRWFLFDIILGLIAISMISSFVAWAVARKIRGVIVVPDASRCAICGYSLIGNSTGICSECGTPIPLQIMGMSLEEFCELSSKLSTSKLG